MNAEQNIRQTIHSLNVTLQRGQDLEFVLRCRKNDEEVKKLEKKNKKLIKEIDKLIANAMEKWMVEAEIVTKKIKTTNASLKRAITSVENKKKEAENIVKAIGLIDDVLAIAASILAI